MPVLQTPPGVTEGRHVRADQSYGLPSRRSLGQHVPLPHREHRRRGLRRHDQYLLGQPQEGDRAGSAPARLAGAVRFLDRLWNQPVGRRVMPVHPGDAHQQCRPGAQQRRADRGALRRFAVSAQQHPGGDQVRVTDQRVARQRDQSADGRHRPGQQVHPLHHRRTARLLRRLERIVRPGLGGLATPEGPEGRHLHHRLRDPDVPSSTWRRACCRRSPTRAPGSRRSRR